MAKRPLYYTLTPTNIKNEQKEKITFSQYYFSHISQTSPKLPPAESSSKPAQRDDAPDVPPSLTDYSQALDSKFRTDRNLRTTRNGSGCLLWAELRSSCRRNCSGLLLRFGGFGILGVLIGVLGGVILRCRILGLSGTICGLVPSSKTEICHPSPSYPLHPPSQLPPRSAPSDSSPKTHQQTQPQDDHHGHTPTHYKSSSSSWCVGRRSRRNMGRCHRLLLSVAVLLLCFGIVFRGGWRFWGLFVVIFSAFVIVYCLLCMLIYVYVYITVTGTQKQVTPQQQSNHIQTLTAQLSMQQPQKQPELSYKNSQADLTFQFEGIKLPLLEMSDPYYPHSKLAKSIFSGYYILFFMYSVIFTITYPLLNFLEHKDLFGITVIKLVETNLIWDLISALLFIFLAFIFIQLEKMLGKNYYRALMAATLVVFMACGFFIVRNYRMYFSDRIFIVVLNWALCAKTLSYIHDKNQQRKKPNMHWCGMEQAKQLTKLHKKILYLMSPYPVYHKFVKQHNPHLKIHIRYLLTKLSVSFLCLFVNNILIVKFIEPACQDPNLSFIALAFKLVPLTFYINMVLYYMVMDNVIAALAEVTRITNRIFYLDWWNAQTIYEFLDKWCLIINMTTQGLIPNITLRTRHALHVAILQVLMLAIFGHSLSLLACIGFVFVEGVVFFLGGIRRIQNNMLVHVLCMSFTPVMIALEVKFSIFSEGEFKWLFS